MHSGRFRNDVVFMDSLGAASIYISGSDKYTQNHVTENCGKLTNVNNSHTTEPMSPRIAENQRMSTRPNKKFVKSMIILGCNPVARLFLLGGKIIFFSYFYNNMCMLHM